MLANTELPGARSQEGKAHDDKPDSTNSLLSTQSDVFVPAKSDGEVDNR